MSDEIDSGLNVDNSYAEQLTGFYTPSQGDRAPAATLIAFNQPLANSLGLDTDNLSEPQLAAMLSGGTDIKGAAPLAQVYAGHQFGIFSPQLGDGRSILLAEVLDNGGQRRDIHLKGSGRTAYSRAGDGKASIGPILREYILCEAMQQLNVPTTRALSVVSTGEKIKRHKPLAGAVLARVASSHIRVGTFEYFADRGQTDKVKLLADYAIKRHFPQLICGSEAEHHCYLRLLSEVCKSQAALVSKWMNLGFVHGVMNTDNMTICGETIDYGPCAFIDSYNPTALFSSIDSQGRYRFNNQPPAALWNLARLGETLLPLIGTGAAQAVEQAFSVSNSFDGKYRQQWLDRMRRKLAIYNEEPEDLTLALTLMNSFQLNYQKFWLDGMRGKLGLSNAEAEDKKLADDLLELMAAQKVDYTGLFRALAKVVAGIPGPAVDLFTHPNAFEQWLARWADRLERDPQTPATRAAAMNAVNPIYIPRNHLVEQAIKAAEDHADYGPFEKLQRVLSQPFIEREGLEQYASAAADTSTRYTTYCGT
ncbi:MAG: YdiU family protein [Pseudomonadales bacterium]|nr:YdiU family protein [Pseudomonadales bacterium]NRA16203.1 YdiU family protein [Oceanospirillaceae bacterium]